MDVTNSLDRFAIALVICGIAYFTTIIWFMCSTYKMYKKMECKKRPNGKVKFTDMANTVLKKCDDSKMRRNIDELSDEELYELYITP